MSNVSANASYTKTLAGSAKKTQPKKIEGADRVKFRAKF